MYDFYGNPPQTKQDIRDYLTSWLQKVDSEEASPFQVSDETFIQEWGFRRAFYQHGVYRNLVTDEYVWWVTEDFNLEKFPRKVYSDFNTMLNQVIDDYYIQWRLTK